MRYKPTKLRIVQGGPRVDRAWIVAAGRRVVAIAVNMHTKRATVEAYIGSQCPGVYVGADEQTLYQRKGREGNPTQITFTDFPGWDIHSADAIRYTLYVCLVRYPK